MFYKDFYNLNMHLKILDIFLIQIGDELGAALEGILPKIGEEQNKDTGETFSDIKKE